MTITIAIASDHAGFDMAVTITNYLDKIKLYDPFDSSDKYGAVFIGPETPDPVDYPIYAHKLCQKVQSGVYDFGILVCGSGIGMSIMANRFKGIRAALCHTEEDARLARQHNHANVLCLAARNSIQNHLFNIVLEFLSTPISPEERHQRRIYLLDNLDTTLIFEPI